MATTLGIVSSITALIENTATFIKYLQDVKNAPKECEELLKELQYLESCLSNIARETRGATANDPWLVTLGQLNNLFDELTTLVVGLRERLKAGSSWQRRLLRRLKWTITKASVEEALGKIERFKTLIIVAGQHDNNKLLHEIQKTLGDLEGKVEEIAENTNVTRQIQMDEKAKTLAAWLSSLDYNAVQRNTLRKRVGDTGQWFLDSSKFRSWVDGSGTSRTLWCPGDPGAGKTVLASLIVDYLRPLVAQKNMAVLCVFCDYRNAGAQTVTSIIRSLLKQLIPIDAGLYSSIESLYEKCHNDQIDPSLDDLEAHLSTQLKKYSPVYLVLDALDEFPGDYGEWRNLIAALESLGDNVRLLVTSRNYSTIRKLFEGDDELCIRAEDGDIRKFITSQLDVAGRFNLYLKDRDDLREKILTGVVEKAKGMFLLASLHVTLLAQSTNRADLVEELDKLPDTITNAHAYLLDRVNKKVKHEKKLAYHIFGWIAFARRRLKGVELQYALAVKPGMKELNADSIPDYDVITSVCAGLVIVDSKGSPTFVHYTTQEYFTSHQDELFPCIHEDMMRTCLTYMSFDIFESPDVLNDNICLEPAFTGLPYNPTYIPARLDFLRIEDKYPFLGYSLNNWSYHARKYGSRSVKNEILAFLQTRTEVALYFERLISGMLPTPAWFAANHGLVHVMEALVKRGVDLQHENALCIAAHAGQLDMVTYLLSRDDVDVNQMNKAMYLHDWDRSLDDPANGVGVGGCCPTLCTPLIAAASNGHEEIVKALLKSKNMKSLNTQSSSGHTALSEAVSGGYIRVVKLLLLQSGINTSVQFQGMTLLMLAARYARRDIVALLLEWGIDPDIPGDSGRTPLHVAARCGRPYIFRMLLESCRVDINRTDDYGRTALSVAAYWGRINCVKALLDQPDLDFTIKDHDGKSAYERAVEGGHDATMVALVEGGVDLQHENALCLSAHAGQLNMVTFLLSQDDVDVNQVNKAMYLHDWDKSLDHPINGVGVGGSRLTSCTPLIAAASIGHEEIVKALLKSKNMKSLNTQSPSGPTALSEAVSGGHVGVVRLLLSQPGINTSIQFQGKTLLMLAARYARRDIAALLLESGIDPDIPGDSGRTPLHVAARWARPHVFRMLLESRRVDINRTDDHGRTALSVAAYWGRINCVKALLDQPGLDFTIKDHDGKSAYERAVEGGRDANVVVLLAEHGMKGSGTQ